MVQAVKVPILVGAVTEGPGPNERQTTGIVWEVTASGLGAQNAIGGGGRYDNLVETLGGKPTPGVGFGSGIERLLIALESQGVTLPKSAEKLIWLVGIGPAAKEANWKLMIELRRAGFICDMEPGDRSVKSQFKVASREQAAYSLTTGETELAAATRELNEELGLDVPVAGDQLHQTRWQGLHLVPASDGERDRRAGSGSKPELPERGNRGAAVL